MLCGASQARLLLDDADIGGPEIVSMLVLSYRLAILGDFDSDFYSQGPYLTMIFFATTFFVLVVVLVVLGWF